MASITISIPDKGVAELSSAIAPLYPTAANGLTGTDAIKAVIIAWLTDNVTQYDAQQAALQYAQKWQSLLDNAQTKWNGAIT